MGSLIAHNIRAVWLALRVYLGNRHLCPRGCFILFESFVNSMHGGYISHDQLPR